jgi:hypothetical protein
LYFFSSTKLENRRSEQVLPWGREGWHQWQGRGGEKGDRRVNIVQKMCIQVYKCKNDTVETVPGIGEWGKGEWWRG